MPAELANRPESIWPWINSDQETMIEEMKKELEKNGGRKITIDQYELSSTETKSLDPKTLEWKTINSSSSPELYKQIALQSSTDGTIPILKHNQFKVSNGNITIDRAGSTVSSPSPLPIMNEIRYNRPESSLSQAVSINMGSNKSTTTTPTPTRISPIRERSISPSRRSKSEKNVSIGGVTEHHEEDSSGREYYSSRNSSITRKPLSDDYIHSSWPHAIDRSDSTGRSSRTSTDSPLVSKLRSESISPSRSRSSSPSRWAIVERGKTHEIKRSPTPAFSTMERSMSSPSVEPSTETGSMTIPRYYRRKVILPTSTTPLPEYMSKLRHIKVATVPGPVIPPKFGTITRGGRWPNEAEGPKDIGPPCELCKKPITEIRFIVQEDAPYHVEHFTCTYCAKTLKSMDFLMSPDNTKPYCVNCYKREFP